MGVGAQYIDLIPPVSAGAGIPLTLTFADDLTDAGGSGTEGYALFDSTLWATASGNNVSPSVPTVVSGASVSYAHGQLLDFAQMNFLGLTAQTESPRLNFATGSLEHGQAMLDAGLGRQATKVKTFSPASTPTVTESGRYLEHPRRTYASSRPANQTWHKARHNDLKDGLPSYDMQLGGLTDIGPSTVGTVDSITHRSAMDLPSNSVGATYGDRHNSGYLSSLFSAPIHDMIATTGLSDGATLDADPKSFSAHWGMNLRVYQEVLASGIPLSAPDSLNTASGHGLTDYDTLDLPPETIQTINVKDIYTDNSNTAQTENLFPLGRVDLGNHAVADTCGLIGYEGIFSATAFMSVSRNSNPPNIADDIPATTSWSMTDNGTFAGINIQVHSGLPLRRNGLSFKLSGGALPLFKYGSDGAYVMPMTEGMITTGSRSIFEGSSFSANANETRFHTGRVAPSLDANGGGRNDLSDTSLTQASWVGASSSDMKQTSKPASSYILGDTHTSGKWSGTIALSQDFMKDKIPTKVKIVPTLVGYETVSVSAGANHPSSDAITFNKPIVDYHVLVSLAPRTRINIGVNKSAGSNIGDPTIRNNPSPNRLNANMNLEDEACEIYHAIFRINPTSLERIWFDPLDPAVLLHGVNSAHSEMPNTVMPRHDSEYGGWGLHQITPFRPLANSSWSQVPLLCGTIETGGFYQRGGISHIWSADTYGKELFVGADMIDANHFNAETWGNGQVWADGTHELGYPRGCELMIFKYNPQTDPYYTPKMTTATDNHLYNRMLKSTSTDYINTVQVGSSFNVVTGNFTSFSCWTIHDWVFPSIELMRYVGREEKFNARHPRHSENVGADPMLHPTLHCASLRFVDDGRMMMLGVHRDYIKSIDEYPSSEVGYPYNPDASSGSGCPAGYYRSGDTCVPITTGDDPSDADTHLDGVTGEVIEGPTPTPSNSSGSGYTGGSDNFGRSPSWSRMLANSSARSLLLLWSDAKAVNGKAVGGRKMFEAEEKRIDGTTYYTQNWTFNDTWWSGSRIAYWYAESGQRAIPLTYGSYPECRMSHAHLPKCLPHIMTTGIAHGYPLLQPIDRMSIEGEFRNFTGTDVWSQSRYDFLVRTRFVPTTVGFSDFGMGANPHQELGWSGWSFPRGLYDPITYGDNSQFFSDDPEVVNTNAGNGDTIGASAQGLWSGFGSSTQFGHMGGVQAFISHHGPLHYGIQSQHHPFRADRVWKQVHGGVGYDVPLHLLSPPQVHVRARAGGRNSLNLELETPFHRTDVRHLEGGANANSGFDLGVKETPNATRTHLGQYYLRTNLWNDDSRTFGSSALTDGLLSGEIRGPIVSGNSLSAFWSDHPTEHFHAGAIPIMPSTDYDMNYIENERYAPAILGRIDEMSRLDFVAVSEQLQSSVDVHVSSISRPFWDSGSIVSARGVGERDTGTNTLVSHERGEMNGETIYNASASASNHDTGLGKGQRILRTPDGTLHTFSIERDASTSSHKPCFVHYTKPLFSDVFWNRKGMKVNPASALYSGADEVPPLLSNLVGSEILRSSAFASDSEGTIHAIVELQETTGKHTLYYSYAKRTLQTHNPYPVYSWDWSVATAVEVNVASGTKYDLRQPSLVCDSQDRLHLACRLVSTSYSYIAYSTKLITDSSFVNLPTYTADPTTWTDTRWSIVSKVVSNPVVSSDNEDAGTSHATKDNDVPKICLLSSDIPLVFYRGGSHGETALGNRENDAIYVNKGRSESGQADPSGRFFFDSSTAIHCLGVHGSAQKNTTEVIYYDALVDENDRAFVVVIKNDNGRSTLMSSFDASKTLSDQHTTTYGLGLSKALFIPKNTDVRPDYRDISMTTNGQGQIHMILGFRLSSVASGGYDEQGEVYRDGVTESTNAPFQWASTPAGELGASPPSAKSSGGGYEAPAGTWEWSTGGTYNMALSGDISHFMEVWLPSFEFSQDASDPDEVIRSINIRWLSVPSMNYDTTNGWYPVGSAQTMSGHEDFTHNYPQLRYQRYWGFDAGELDLKWNTNELSWYHTGHGGSRLYYPYSAGSFMTVGEGYTGGEGVAGWE